MPEILFVRDNTGRWHIRNLRGLPARLRGWAKVGYGWSLYWNRERREWCALNYLRFNGWYKVDTRCLTMVG